MTFSATNLAKVAKPRLPYKSIATIILGSRYRLSLVFTDKKLIRTLNARYRKKRGPTNVLAFSFAKNEGELFLCTSIISYEAKSLHVPLRPYVAYIFIHGLLHLKGERHGSTMKVKERGLLKKFGFRDNPFFP